MKLIVKNLSKSYKGRKVVKAVSLELSSSEIVGLLGPNGAGKTTSFYMIVGLINSDSGSIDLIDDDNNLINLSIMPMHKRAKYGLGYLPQDSSIFQDLSVSDNILAVLELNKNISKTDRINRLEQLLDEVRLTHIQDSKAISASGGERRRLEVARALAMDPKFMLLDEPFAGVDPISIADIINIVQFLRKKGVGVLISDHNVRETLKICDKSYVLGEGSIIASGTAKQIVNNPLIKKVYLGDNFRYD